MMKGGKGTDGHNDTPRPSRSSRRAVRTLWRSAASGLADLEVSDRHQREQQQAIPSFVWHLVCWSGSHNPTTLFMKHITQHCSERLLSKLAKAGLIPHLVITLNRRVGLDSDPEKSTRRSEKKSRRRSPGLHADLTFLS
ncbi:hypothetical protein BLNAU_7395 [Blattamonas nauphoetae]|uniref:Transposase n=1 Tax=Blattamonas nauphoetae TaxID=2049346 RepID=A0ABQ9Y176_9EUKA|nr:hypothetical protein BLNAU_7395 [Blattamonas nauphoetae]